MFILFFILWVILNGRITWEIVWFGLGISAAVYWFVCKFMDYSPGKDWRALRKAGKAIKLGIVLLIEIIKANRQVILWIYSSKYKMEPAVVHFKTDLKTENAKVALANCITLTPGTITATLEGDEYTVHCLDRDMGEGIDQSVFVDILKEMEEM